MADTVPLLLSDYQYCFSPKASHSSENQHFFESLNPLADFNNKETLETYLYNRSQEIEPKECDKPPYFPPLRGYSLKSPGIKPPSSKHTPHAQKMRIKGSGTMEGGFHRSSSSRSDQAFDDNILKEKQMAAANDVNSDFAVVDIRPGDPRGPIHVADLPDHRFRQRYCNPPTNGRRKSSNSPPQVSSPSFGHRSGHNRGGTLSSGFSPPVRYSATPTPSSSGLLGPDSPPPLPPRSSTLGRPSPTPGPKPSRLPHGGGIAIQHRQPGSGSPHSPLSPPATSDSPPTFSEAIMSGRHSGWSPMSCSPQSGGGQPQLTSSSGGQSGKSFVFPPHTGAAPAFFGVHSTTLPAGIGGHYSRVGSHSSASSSTTLINQENSPAAGVPLSGRMYSPPNVPPRQQGGRHKAPLPPPLSPTLVQQEIALASTSSSIKESSPPRPVPTGSDQLCSSPPQARRSSSCMSDSSGPPLPPRTTPRGSLNSPPPRPPKRNQPKRLDSSSSNSYPGPVLSPAPPLPPKTYKQKKG